jgi:hypothetical protein
MKKTAGSFIAVCVGFLFSACGEASERQAALKSSAAKTAERGARYLVEQTQPDGRFVYRRNMNPAVTVSPRYNMLRHAGAIYAMADYYQDHPDRPLLEAIKRSARYLQHEAMGAVPGQPGLLAVWSRPEVNRTGSPLQAKLGGTGLGLVALMSTESIQPGFTPLEDARALGRFLVFMQRPNGSFCSKYIPSEGGFRDDWVSLYYPGEAALGLTMLYEKDRSDLWRDAAAQALCYLARTREGKTSVPADHWALLASARLYPHVDAATRAQLLAHAIQVCEVMLADQISDGGFNRSGAITPTSTRLEGLQAALTFIPPEHELYGRVQTAVEAGIRFLSAAEITEGNYAGGIPRAIGPVNPEVKDAASFNQRCTEIRIDYVQHALSAMLAYIRAN